MLVCRIIMLVQHQHQFLESSFSVFNVQEFMPRATGRRRNTTRSTPYEKKGRWHGHTNSYVLVKLLLKVCQILKISIHCILKQAVRRNLCCILKKWFWNLFPYWISFELHRTGGPYSRAEVLDLNSKTQVVCGASKGVHSPNSSWHCGHFQWYWRGN